MPGRETVIRFEDGSPTLQVETASRGFSRLLARVALQVGGQCIYNGETGVTRATLPREALLVLVPKRRGVKRAA